MPNTPKATDGETPKKRTRKTASAPEDSTKVTKTVAVERRENQRSDSTLRLRRRRQHSK